MHRKRLCCALSCNKFQHRRKIAPSGEVSRRRLTFCRAASAALYLFSHEMCRGGRPRVAVKGAGALRMRHTPCGCCLPAAPQARDVFSYSPQCRYDCATATVAPRAFVLASFISLAPPQAAGLVHCAARPLQTANAALVCCLVPFLSCQKKVCKKEAQENEIALTRGKTSRSILRIIVSLSVDRTPFGRP